MFDILGQLDFNLASVVSGLAGVIGCWLVQRIFARYAQARPSSEMLAPASRLDWAVIRQQRAAEDELVLRWLNEEPGTCIAEAANARPELALEEIAAELLPFNPIAVRFVNKVTESDMTAAVERIESLLASVDPPASLGTLPASSNITAAIRDPAGRMNSQPDEPQRRRSDQAILYDELLRRCLGDDDFAWRMLNKFPPRCRAELESLATELRRRAWISATRRINQLRGMAANIAAENLREALANLEHVCRQQSATRADQLLEGVQHEFQHVLDYIARAAGICPLPKPAAEQTLPLSRWPATLLTEDHHTPETNLSVRVC